MTTTPPNSSLVKYDTPVLVSKNTEKKTPKSKQLKTTAAPVSDGSVVPTRAKTIGEASSETEEVLNAILPPKEWTEGGQLWVQQVSSTPATRLDVVAVQEELDRNLQQRQARETGICPVRRELYSQCFDEIIRQVTISCGERGLLLLRVRDEIRMTISAYQTLYESSVAFGMRKALQAEQGKSDMERQIKDLETDKSELERQVNELKSKCEQIEKRALEQRQVEEKKHSEEIQFLKRTNQQLKTQLEGIITSKK
jgi:dynein light intermediate chain